MCAVTNRAKLYQLALLIKKSLGDVIVTQQSSCKATLQHQHYNVDFSLIYALFAEILLIHLEECAFYITYKSYCPCMCPLTPTTVLVVTLTARMIPVTYGRHQSQCRRTSGWSAEVSHSHLSEKRCTFPAGLLLGPQKGGGGTFLIFFKNK